MDEPALRLKAQVAQARAGVRQRLVVRDDHPALSGGHELVRVEAERTDVAEAAAWPTGIRLTEHLGRVLQDV